MEMSSVWLGMLDEVLEAAGGALRWPELRRQLLRRCKQLGLERDHLALELLASIPESYLSNEDAWVRRPSRPSRSRQTSFYPPLSVHVISCGDVHALQQELKAAGCHLVAFGSRRCGACGAAVAEFHQLAAEMPELRCLQVDADMNAEAADSFKVAFLPTFLFIRNEKVIGRYEGADVDALTLKALECK
ncbi:unnamed protein product [Effrenium voratum]|nr:unnamed protein product [Effrenium voratum]CAJ1428070.1 unnamed protein product [Effrenium voratum]